MTLKLATIATFVRNDRTTFSPHKPRQRSTKNTTEGRRLRAHRGKETEEGGALPYFYFGGGLNTVPIVVGPDDGALRFIERAAEFGIDFLDPMPQRIHSLAQAPKYPGAPGRARLAAPADCELLMAWMAAFVREAIPHDSPPCREMLEKGVAEGRYFIWVVDDEPVSTAAIVRRTRHAGGIAAVFTPRDFRGKGYAGSITAAVVEALLREGKTMACLNTDSRNPISNRCYAKIGFMPVCDATFFPRRLSA